LPMSRSAGSQPVERTRPIQRERESERLPVVAGKLNKDLLAIPRLLIRRATCFWPAAYSVQVGTYSGYAAALRTIELIGVRFST
jgi:hypothetical protein